MPDPHVLLDSNTPFDKEKVALLDNVVDAMFLGSTQEQSVAHSILTELKQQPESWRVVGTILENSSGANTKFFALSLLQSAIQTRWNVLPEEQRSGIREYITYLSLECAKNPALRAEKHFVTKVNETLIEVVKKEWPDRWPTFIADLCDAAKTNQDLCENNMKILNMLSEDLFDFGEDSMTSKKCQKLMESMNSQFQKIFDLCIFIVENHVQNPGSISSSLLSTTLQCLCHFLRWISLDYVFGTKLMDILLGCFWESESPSYKLGTLKCFTEIASLKDIGNEGLAKVNWMHLRVVAQMKNVSLATMQYDTKMPSNSRLFWESFYLQLALFLTTFLKNHRVDICERQVENDTNYDAYYYSLELLCEITKIPHDETLRICIDYWHYLSETLLLDIQESAKRLKQENESPLLLSDANCVEMDEAEMEPVENPEVYSKLLPFYQPLLDRVREVMVIRMAKPAEVYVNYDEETGTVDRDYEPDTDEIALYQRMRETLIFLTNLGGEETMKIMESHLQEITDKLKIPGQKDEWNPMALNRLCWSIGSISGAVSSYKERHFLVKVIKDLLWLCENKRGTENKAVVAAMVMYVVGQYPRFLRSHFRFLEVVIQKLFQFMEEKFPGVQDMAVETFLKITQRCQRRMALPVSALDQTSAGSQTTAPGHALLEWIIQQMPIIQSKVSTPRQVLIIYEAVGQIISACPPHQKKEAIDILMTPTNLRWQKCIVAMEESLNDEQCYEVAKTVSEIIRINNRVCYSAGPAFACQFLGLFDALMNMYYKFSQHVAQAVAEKGPASLGHAHVRTFRQVKRDTLKLVEVFVDSATTRGDNVKTDLAMLLPNLLPPVLQGYKACPSEAKDPEVLSLLCVLLKRLPEELSKNLEDIFNFTFGSTLNMINTDLNSYPDHRAKFFELLTACNNYCFPSLLQLPATMLNLYVEAIVFGFKHEQPAIMEQGLLITKNFVGNLIKCANAGDTKVILEFSRHFFKPMFIETLNVMTDTLHKSGLKYQTQIVHEMVWMIDSGMVNDPASGLDKQQITELLIKHFGSVQQLSKSQLEAFALDLFNKCGDVQAFTEHLHDFLIQMKEFAGSDNLFQSEKEEAIKRAQHKEQLRASIPGLTVQQIEVLLKSNEEEEE